MGDTGRKLQQYLPTALPVFLFAFLFIAVPLSLKPAFLDWLIPGIGVLLLGVLTLYAFILPRETAFLLCRLGALLYLSVTWCFLIPQALWAGITGTLFFISFLFEFFNYVNRRKRYKILTTVTTYKVSGKRRTLKEEDGRVLMDPSLYNEIIAVFNIFSHLMESFPPAELDALKRGPVFHRIEQARYHLMTPEMEKNRLLFSRENFESVRTGLKDFNSLLENIEEERIAVLARSPDFKLVVRVFRQLDLDE